MNLFRKEEWCVSHSSFFIYIHCPACKPISIISEYAD